MSEQEPAAAAEAPPAPTQAPAEQPKPKTEQPQPTTQPATESKQKPKQEPKTEPKQEQVTVNVQAAEAEAAKGAAKRKAEDEDSTPRKRRTPSPRTTKKTPAEGEETESEPEKQPKKRAKRGPKPGRKKKVVEVEPNDAQEEVEKKVAALSDEIKGRFGQIVWAKMGGYPYWPCIITDPRLLPPKLQETAMKTLETKYLVFFFVSNNFAPISFKMIEPWDDTKFNYREGHPEKDSKAPKRRVKLMQAIEVADKEVKMPIEERADGLLKPEEKIEAAEEQEEAPAPVKRKPGRPRKIQTATKSVNAKIPNKRGPKPKGAKMDAAQDASSNAGKGPAPTTAQEDEEDTEGPPLSKEEIKAKVASRKTPKKKGSDEGTIAVGTSAKKTAKPIAKHGKSNGATEIDSKRKKEIELVVPHKSVKSADIREMTEEAAKKKLSAPKSKTKKDKGEYKVGDLGSFSSKMARLHAKESARNNDELVGMMQELFKETLMYRSDVERSGLAAVIAQLRKSLSPTVGQTASALRKHMIRILDNDTDITHLGKKPHHETAGHAAKKQKAENGSTVKSEEQQPKTETLSPVAAAAAEYSDGKENSTITTDKVSSPPTKKPEDTSSKDIAAVNVKEEKTPDQTSATETSKDTPAEDVVVKSDSAEQTGAATENESSPSTELAEKPIDISAKDIEEMFEAPENLDKNRTIFVDMLRKILAHGGSKRDNLATEIEAALFERFKESNDDYLTQARIIIFGLKENARMRARLYSGALHCLEFAYADDAFFKAAE